MASTLESTAKSLLAKPTSNNVFKNTYDVIEDWLNRVLVAIAAVGVAIRLAPGLTSGFLVCIVHSVHPLGDSEFHPKDLAYVSASYHASLATYAAQDSYCHDKVSLGTQ